LPPYSEHGHRFALNSQPDDTHDALSVLVGEQGPPNGLELHPPFPKDIGTMCGLGKGAARRLGLGAFGL